LIKTDLAETYTKWRKVNKCYEHAYHRFGTSLAASGENQFLQYLWALAMREHAIQAHRHGQTELAHALAEQAGLYPLSPPQRSPHLLT